MTHNPILDEIRESRERILADNRHDLTAYIESARKRAIASGREIVPAAATPLRDKRRNEPSTTDKSSGTS